MNTDKHTFNKRYLWVPAIALVLLVLTFLIPELTRTHHPQSETSAVGSLVTIHRAAQEYERIYQNGFPVSLQTLGPPARGQATNCNAAHLIDDVLVTGIKAGYAFPYVPGPPVDEPRTGCQPGVRTFVLTARPTILAGRSFFVDETGVIRLTDENRAAHAQDMTLDEYMNRPKDPKRPIPEE